MRLPKEKIIFVVDFLPVGTLPGRGMIDFYPLETEAAIKKILAMDWERLIPGHPGARCNHRRVLGCSHRCCRRGGACPLARAAGRIASHIPHKVFEPVRNVAAKHLEPLRPRHQLEIALQSFVHVRAVHDHSRVREISHLLQRKRGAQHVLREFLTPLRGDGSGAILTLRFPLRAAAYNTGQPG